jgi:hypothetical protein
MGLGCGTYTERDYQDEYYTILFNAWLKVKVPHVKFFVVLEVQNGTVIVTTPGLAAVYLANNEAHLCQLALCLYISNCVGDPPLKKGDCIEFVDESGEATTLTNVPVDGVIRKKKWRLAK